MPKPYDVIFSSVKPVWTQTCSYSGGCTFTSNFPNFTVQTRQQTLVNPTKSNNGRNRKIWSNFSLTKSHARGAARSEKWWNTYSWDVWNPSKGGYDHFYNIYQSQESWRGMWYSTGQAPPVSRVMSEADAIAQAKLFARLKDARTQWSAAVALGEARETATHILHTATRIYKAYVALRKGRLGDVYNNLLGNPLVPDSKVGLHRRIQRQMKRPNWKDNVAGVWMEFSYAWVPLLGDIDSAARYFAEKMVGKTYRVYRVTAAHRLRGDWRGPTGMTSIGGNEYVREISHVRYTYELDPDWLRKPSTMDELGFTDPLSVAWELLPLSFVTDWFVNVGQVLESLTEFRRWTVRRGIKSSGLEFARLAVGSDGATTSLGYTSYEWKWPSSFMTVRTSTRTVLNNLPTAVPLKINVSNPFDLKVGQMASALALLRYAFR